MTPSKCLDVQRRSEAETVCRRVVGVLVLFSPGHRVQKEDCDDCDLSHALHWALRRLYVPCTKVEKVGQEWACFEYLQGCMRAKCRAVALVVKTGEVASAGHQHLHKITW